MGCHTWFFRPIKENEIAKYTCDYSDEMFSENWEDRLKEFWSKNPDGVIEFG